MDLYVFWGMHEIAISLVIIYEEFGIDRQISNRNEWFTTDHVSHSDQMSHLDMTSKCLTILGVGTSLYELHHQKTCLQGFQDWLTYNLSKTVTVCKRLSAIKLPLKFTSMVKWLFWELKTGLYKMLAVVLK